MSDMVVVLVVMHGFQSLVGISRYAVPDCFLLLAFGSCLGLRLVLGTERHREKD